MNAVPLLGMPQDFAPTQPENMHVRHGQLMPARDGFIIARASVLGKTAL
jgi:hypothetical protein